MSTIKPQLIGWYYLHANGDMIYKRGLGETAADIRESDFAVAMWPMDQSRGCAWRICVEGLAAGANQERIRELALKWELDEEDAINYAQYLGGNIRRDGDKWCAVGPGFRDLTQDPAGFGDTPVEAFADLCTAIGYKPTKMWGPTFKDMLSKSSPPSTTTPPTNAT